ncbi:hypothetical protein SpCBS45565_g02045 [Spizellomyces sp. 'palustris']|nr:hypothetical protein SpCBS45565_g02045 [Spizellomyces sp. 'palustris']
MEPSLDELFLSATAAVTAPLLHPSSFHTHQDIDTHMLDFDMSFFDDFSTQQQLHDEQPPHTPQGHEQQQQPQQQQQQQQQQEVQQQTAGPVNVGDMSSMHSTTVHSFLSSGAQLVASSSIPTDPMMISPVESTMSLNPPSGASTTSPWGSLPSEPNVMRLSRHRRVASIGSPSGNDKAHHLRSPSFQVLSPGGSLSGGEQSMDQLKKNVFRPSHRRGMSVGGHSLNTGQMAAHPSVSALKSPPLHRQNSFPLSSPKSPSSPSPTSPWLQQQQHQSPSSTHIRTPPRASLPDISDPLPPTVQAGRTQTMGHRRGYSIGTFAPEPASHLPHSPVNDPALVAIGFSMAARRQHSTDSIPSSATNAAVHARQLALGHRRGNSLGHGLASPGAQMHSSPQLDQHMHLGSGTMQVLHSPTASSVQWSAPSSPGPVFHQQNHSRRESHSSQASFLHSPSLTSTSDVDPQILETFVNMQLHADAEFPSAGSSDLHGLGTGSSEMTAQIQQRELSILTDLQGGMYPFGMEELGMDMDELGMGMASEDQSNTATSTTSGSNDFLHTPLGLPDAAALAAEALLGASHKDPMMVSTPKSQPPSLSPTKEEPKEEDEEDGSGNSCAEDDEDTEETAAVIEQVEHRCQWTNCDELFDTVEELVSHISDLHIGSGKATYKCEWANCTRNQRPFTKRHKIHNHLRIHTGERPFECPVPDCGKKFSRQDGLNTHIRTHSNIKPYVCGFFGCGKAYYHSRSLRKHEKSHLHPVLLPMNLLPMFNQHPQQPGMVQHGKMMVVDNGFYMSHPAGYDPIPIVPSQNWETDGRYLQ